MGHVFSQVDKNIKEEFDKVNSLYRGEKREYIVLDQVLQIQQTNWESHAIDFTHLGTLFVLDRNHDGRFCYEVYLDIDIDIVLDLYLDIDIVLDIDQIDQRYPTPMAHHAYTHTYSYVYISLHRTFWRSQHFVRRRTRSSEPRASCRVYEPTAPFACGSSCRRSTAVASSPSGFSVSSPRTP